MNDHEQSEEVRRRIEELGRLTQQGERPRAFGKAAVSMAACYAWISAARGQMAAVSEVMPEPIKTVLAVDSIVQLMEGQLEVLDAALREVTKGSSDE